jgi:hypothetical protein
VLVALDDAVDRVRGDEPALDEERFQRLRAARERVGRGIVVVVVVAAQDAPSGAGSR